MIKSDQARILRLAGLRLSTTPRKTSIATCESRFDSGISLAGTSLEAWTVRELYHLREQFGDDSFDVDLCGVEEGQAVVFRVAKNQR